MTTAIDLFNVFATDTNAEENGVYTLLPECGDTEWLIARDANSAYRRLADRLLKQNNQKLNSKGAEAEKASEALMVELLSKTILLGWKGTISFQGEQVPYSREVAVKLLTLKDFRKKVTDASQSKETFLLVKDEDAEKN